MTAPTAATRKLGVEEKPFHVATMGKFGVKKIPLHGTGWDIICTMNLKTVNVAKTAR